LPAALGHRRGVENLRKLLPSFIEHKITNLTVYALSTENLKERKASELKHLFRLIEKFIADDTVFFENKIQVNVFGELRNFPSSTKKALKDLVERTRPHKKLTLNLALGYGGKNEIVEACNKFVKSGKKANEKTFEKALYSSNQPTVDLLIRTGGKKRISNFLLWQLAYAELCFIDKMWPEFDEAELKKILKWFHKQQRNFGK
jgi:undecaprenyl diphosphate synthase